MSTAARREQSIQDRVAPCACSLGGRSTVSTSRGGRAREPRLPANSRSPPSDASSSRSPSRSRQATHRTRRRPQQGKALAIQTHRFLNLKPLERITLGIRKRDPRGEPRNLGVRARRHDPRNVLTTPARERHFAGAELGIGDGQGRHPPTLPSDHRPPLRPQRSEYADIARRQTSDHGAFKLSSA